MRYLLLIYQTEPAPDVELPAEAIQAQTAAYAAFTRDVRERGVMLAGEALQSIATATTVRVREGRTLVTDGPFAETKEQLGGFYLFECADLDEAVELAARIPGAERGSIEIRPVWEQSMGTTESDPATGAAAD